MSAALGLYRLQQIDSRLSQVEARLARIRETLASDEALRAAQEQVRSAEAALRQAERAHRQAEAERQDQQVKIQQAEAALYGGHIHNPKELQDLEADVRSLKKHLAVLEDRELEAMLEVERAQAASQQARENLKNVEARLGSEHRDLLSEQEQLSCELENLRDERQAAVLAIPADMLALYENLRQQRRGVAVAEVSESACGACGTTLTPAQQQSARHAAQLVYCPSCGRILYAH